MSETPFFSIVIPAYNRAGFLPQTIQSLREQVFQAWECIVVDDGSTDNTREVVSELAKEDARVRYVYQENAERSAARNNGAAHSKGQYVCFLDSDDAFLPEYFSTLYDFLAEKNFPEALVVTNFEIWNGVDSVPQETPPLQGNPAEWLFTHPVSPTRACVHKKIFETFRFREDIVIVEDSVLWVSIATKFPVLHLQKPLVRYRVHEDNSVNRASKAAFSRLAGLKKFFRDPLSRNVGPSLRKHLLSDVRFRIAEYYALHGKKFQMLQYIIRSILTDPFHRHTKAKIFLVVQNFSWLRKIYTMGKNKS